MSVSDYLDYSGSKRLRISSLIDMPADEEGDMCELFVTANGYVEEMRSRGMDPANWNKLIGKALDGDDPAVLKKVILHMQNTIRADFEPTMPAKAAKLLRPLALLSLPLPPLLHKGQLFLFRLLFHSQRLSA